MLKLLLILIVSPFIILAATAAICALIASGFETIIKLAIIACIICGVRWVFAKCNA